MTWVALFTSWQFWLVIVLNTFASWFCGVWTVALMQANGPDEPPPVNLSQDAVELRAEVQRLTEANTALKVINADLESQLDALDPGYADNASELQSRPNQAAD